MSKIPKLMTIYFLSITALFSTVILLRTRFVSAIETHITPSKKVSFREDFSKQIERLSKGIAINTSNQANPATVDTARYKQFIELIRLDFPLIHANMNIKRLNKLSFLYRWKGSNSTLQPILFLKNYDLPYYKYAATIPDTSAINKLRKLYSNYPNAKNEEYIHGYGAQYTKSSLYALLEVLESLIQMNFQPQRDIYFTLTHDNESGGKMGSKKVASYLRYKGITFDAIYDKGGYVSTEYNDEQLTPHNLSIVGISEKGRYSAIIEARDANKTSPNKETFNVWQIINELEAAGTQIHITEPVFNSMKMMLNNVNFWDRLAIANKLLFESLILDEMQTNKKAKPFVTNTPLVCLHYATASDQKVTPVCNKIGVDIRILPNSSTKDVETYLKKICEKFDVTIKPIEMVEPSAASPTESKGYRQLVKSIEGVFPNTSIMPGLTLRVTNSHHFQHLSPNIYRFTPAKLGDGDLKSKKTNIERLSHTSFKEMCYFYYYLISQYDK